MFSYVDDFSLTVWSPFYRANTRHLQCWAEDLRYQAAKIRLDFSLPKPELIHWRTIQESGTRCTHPITHQQKKIAIVCLRSPRSAPGAPETNSRNFLLLM